MNKNVNITDMTVGNPTKHILLFALPVMIGNIFQQLYNTVDSFVVGKYVSADALFATLLGVFFARPILRLMSTPDKIFCI